MRDGEWNRKARKIREADSLRDFGIGEEEIV